MDRIASGHVAFWDGGALWVFDVRSGPGFPTGTAMHKHHAFQLTLSLAGDLKIDLEDRELCNPSVLIAPDILHALSATGSIALLFVAPESRSGRALAKLLDGQPGANLDPNSTCGALDLITGAVSDHLDRRQALREAGLELCRRLARQTAHFEIDRRARQMINWVDANLDDTISIRDVAAAVGLSTSRASHLFVEQTGLPFRTYLLWRRVNRAVDAYAMGQSLTSAAQEAGFSDSAHLSRTFSRMFGIPAASLRIT